MTAERQPDVVVLAGPNGAGKTTAARVLLPSLFGIHDFVNADAIATGLSAFDPESVAMAAGRIMLARIRQLAAGRESFAFETTLASRTVAPLLRDLLASGYAAHLIYLWLPSPEVAVQRVADRVRRGGHHVPAEIVRRRYANGLRNFCTLYAPVASTWRLYDNTGANPVLIAQRIGTEAEDVVQPASWESIQRGVPDR